MLESLFSFSGRMGRLSYFLWTLALVAIAIPFNFAVSLVVMLVVGITAGVQGMASPVLIATLTVVLSVPSLWAGLALATKRTRDLGIAPGLAVVGLVAVCALDLAVVGRLTPVRFVWPYHHFTPVFGMAATVFYLVLLLWPGYEPAPEAAPRGLFPDEPAPRPDPVPREPRTLPALDPVPVGAGTLAAFREAGARPAFGRRGR